jgi:hypothetical protein
MKLKLKLKSIKEKPGNKRDDAKTEAKLPEPFVTSI